MNIIFSLILLIATSISAMDNFDKQDTTSFQTSLLPYPEFVIPMPPTTPTPLEIKKAKQRALGIIYEALRSSSSAIKKDHHKNHY